MSWSFVYDELDVLSLEVFRESWWVIGKIHPA